jgi:Tol biopolymer transport system component
MKNLIILAFAICNSASAQVPDTDVWLLKMQVKKDSIYPVKALNISNRSGYDNQPSFSPDSKMLYYTSMQEETQTDIMCYNISEKKASALTGSKTSEYSPTPVPGTTTLSVVMVESDSTQRLWEVETRSSKSRLLLPEVDSVGYHCWSGKDSLGLVIITEPLSLLVAAKEGGKARLLSSDCGRCLVTTSDGFYYLHNTSAGGRVMHSRKGSTSLVLPKEIQDFSLLQHPTGEVIVYALGSKIFFYSLQQSKVIGGAELQSFGLNDLSRLAISPDMKYIAVVNKNK